METVPEPAICRIELTPLFVPFKEQVRKAMASSEGGLGMAIPAEEAWLGGDFVICKLVAEDGSVGLGEAFVWLPETGVSPEQLVHTVEHGLQQYVLGESPFRVEKLCHRMDANVTRNEVAKGLIDMACYDLMGHITGRSAMDFMGGQSVEEVPLAGLVPLLDIDMMVALAQGYVQEGKQTIRLKLGNGIGEDRRIMERFRETFGDDIRMRVDYNQAYTPPDAVRAIKAIEPFGIDFAEQPVRGTDYLGMAYVQQRVDTPLMSHEGCFSFQDIVTLIELDAVKCVGINSERPGGVTKALQAIDYAAHRGLTCVLHNQPLGISSAMQLHLGAVKHHALGHASELCGDLMLEDDLIADPIDYASGSVAPPQGSGWGVTLDEDALAKYATASTTVLERS